MCCDCHGRRTNCQSRFRDCLLRHVAHAIGLFVRLDFDAGPGREPVWAAIQAERTEVRWQREWTLSLGECLAKVTEAGTLLALLTFARAMDEQQVEIGARLLEEALRIGELPQTVRSDWYLEGATFHALVGGDLKRATGLLERARTSGSHAPGYTLLVEAAVFLVQGKKDDARVALSGWLEHVSRAPNPNYTRAGHEWALDEFAKRLGPAST